MQIPFSQGVSAARLLFLLQAVSMFARSATADAADDPMSSFSATTDPKPTDFIDCNDPCNGGDVNYELIASVQTIRMAFGNHTYRGRTFARPDPATGEIPFGQHMGPTLSVKPGQSLWIKFRNELGTSRTTTATWASPKFGVDAAASESFETDKDLLPRNVTLEDYWIRLQNPGEKIKYQYYRKAVDSPDLMQVDWSNIPKNYDHTNLHLHGLDVEVHMFDPVGTHNPEAPHVNIGPNQCYCYRFQLPEDHPDGLYWYHPHLHGSSAVQLWGGMMGLIKVEGSLKEELLSYNIVDSRDFVIWDPAFQDVTSLKPNADHDIEVDEFLNGQTTLSKIHPFLVNGEITPLFDDVGVGEILHFRILCGTIENENTFIVYKAPDQEGSGEEIDYSTWDWNEKGLPFWVIASDGVTSPKPRQKQVIVMAGGQREEVLLRFDEPGNYVISQQGIQGMQFFDMYGHPHDQLLAKIKVVDKGPDLTNLPKIPENDILAMEFTPGYAPSETIQSHQISKTESIVFSMGANMDTAPFPQYYVNGKPFQSDRLDFHAYPGQAVEYILINANHNVHPFHIHVNRFQVQEMGSELSVEDYPALAEVMKFDPEIWRDTVIVPPNGRARIWVQYKNYTGKTVFHCHFLAHEDTGMMSTLFIGDPHVLFKWKDHLPLLLGCGVGILVGIALAILVCLIFRPQVDQEHYYSVVGMNEAKTRAVSKTMD